MFVENRYRVNKVQRWKIEYRSRLNFGKDQTADAENLPNYAKERFEVVIVAKKTEEHETEKISSSRIRRLLSEGRLDEANHLLGYIYEISGTVIHGEARGRKLGYPTANIQVPDDMKLLQDKHNASSKFLNIILDGVVSIRLQR